MARRASTSNTTTGRAKSAGTGGAVDSVEVKKPRAKAAKRLAQSGKVETTLSSAMVQSINAISEDAIAFSTRSLEQTVATAGALIEARNVGEVIELQTRCATGAWHQAFDYWAKLGETTARTAQKGLFGS